MLSTFEAVVALHERMCEQYPELRDVPMIGPVTFEKSVWDPGDYVQDAEDSR